ncbi:hypothetical protein BO94DRAFT_101510 [Aspergillus sclerotioniger CBS 115572]|uniref:Uncharacterized protein n=1 Tax=Aspergillus sclerotioniger CBS 115572 TaxID=1450535 RepID=A0A317WJX9_9EURO|nr:hypothetical protein BO94DRAFT_101510 [Aspergillus sclerotioniger CBS 115572]PWY84510.1 hypothetical protein BO94DRAFT_101510 [Aspergillus sclerotioniger CBS 115572]
MICRWYILMLAVSLMLMNLQWYNRFLIRHRPVCDMTPMAALNMTSSSRKAFYLFIIVRAFPIYTPSVKFL